MKKTVYIFLLIPALLFSVKVFAMSSDTYRIDYSSINSGGIGNNSDVLFFISDKIGEIGLNKRAALMAPLFLYLIKISYLIIPAFFKVA